MGYYSATGKDSLLVHGNVNESQKHATAKRKRKEKKNRYRRVCEIVEKAKLICSERGQVSGGLGWGGRLPAKGHR